MACLFEVISNIDVAHTISILQSVGHYSHDLQSYGAVSTPHYKVALLSALNRLNAESRVNFCSEVVRLKGTIRDFTSPKYKFTERWARLERSLALDGYGITGDTIVSTDPISEQLVTTEGSLDNLIRATKVPEASDIISLIDHSAEDFVKQPPDFNGCLGNIRTALETLAKSLARLEQIRLREERDTSKWGNALSYLTAKKFLSEKEEKILASIYTLLSEEHRPIRITEEEMVRFARALALSACWLLAKKGLA
jgi:hypothetical protein